MADPKDGAQLDANKKSWFKPWMLIPLFIGLAFFAWAAGR